jgi:hypothetical protein
MHLPLRIFESWNRRLHFYVGLVLLPFVGLFALTGLLLNHPEWSFTEFWANRHESNFQRPIRPATGGTDLEKAQDVMRQLGISGQVQGITMYPASGHFDFSVVRPGRIISIQANSNRGLASVKRIQTNGWGVLHMLHTFSGVRIEDPSQQRNWVLTSLWSLSMDACVISLAFMALSSVWMWYRLRTKRRLGMIVLAAGILSCGFFVVGLRWIT